VAISTISSNSTSVALPDLDVSVFNNLNAGLNTSPQMLSILLSSTAALSLSASIAQVDLIDDNIKNNAVTKNPPLPTWATYTNRSNEPAFTAYSSNMQPMFGGYLRDDTEGQDWPDRGARYTNTSQDSRGTGHSSVKGTNYQQDEGNWLVRLPGHAPASGSDGQFAHSVWYNLINEHWPFFGTMIQKPGIRPRQSIYYRNNNLGEINYFSKVHALQKKHHRCKNNLTVRSNRSISLIKNRLIEFGLLELSNCYKKFAFFEFQNFMERNRFCDFQDDFSSDFMIIVVIIIIIFCRRRRRCIDFNNFHRCNFWI
jgi:hypothetical protein